MTDAAPPSIRWTDLDTLLSIAAVLRAQGRTGSGLSVERLAAELGDLRAAYAELNAITEPDLRAELVGLRAQRDALLANKPGDPVWSAEFDRLHGVIAALGAQRDAALALHKPHRGVDELKTREFCGYCNAATPWPCPTAAALGVQPEPDNG